MEGDTENGRERAEETRGEVKTETKTEGDLQTRRGVERCGKARNRDSEARAREID